MESFEGLLGRTAELLAKVEELDDATRDDVYDLLDAVDELHRRGLEGIASSIDPVQLQRLATVPAAAWLLNAYGLLPPGGFGSVPVEIRPRPPQAPS